jgi:hypothetical protein
MVLRESSGLCVDYDKVEAAIISRELPGLYLREDNGSLLV